MKILDLSLTYHWFDEIASGQKKEEYREIKPFYQKLLMSDYKKDAIFCSCNGCNVCHKADGLYPLCYPLKYSAIRFHRGQGSPTTMLIQCLDIQIGYGKTEWGAPKNKKVFIFKLGNIIQ